MVEGAFFCSGDIECIIEFKDLGSFAQYLEGFKHGASAYGGDAHAYILADNKVVDVGQNEVTDKDILGQIEKVKRQCTKKPQST